MCPDRILGLIVHSLAIILAFALPLDKLTATLKPYATAGVPWRFG